ncbi:hypothetical protein GCM10010276_38490 [Streptomyces longisporus]|uniref:Uncharacterized protein n=1 Tax=Streptomyces longisporus TaxID=1948 RepID=A0ABN3M6A6_STRLO
MPGAVHAPADDDLVPAVLNGTNGDVEALTQFLGDAARRRCDANTVTGTQRRWVSNGHAPDFDMVPYPKNTEFPRDRGGAAPTLRECVS